MSSQKISLTPERIILLLHDIEKKLPPRRYTTYSIPFTDNRPIPLMALNGEAKKMMNFVGLSEFEPDCEWTNLPNGTAGNILLNGSLNGPIKIRLSEIYRSNAKATIAILAHEICHKLLEYHGLYYSTDALSELNEIYTELTTIFIGFGNIILSGYSTFKDGVNYSLGYLDYINYSTILQIVEAFYNSQMIQSPLLGGKDCILNKWISSESKRQDYFNGFIDEQKSITECLKSLSMLQEAIGSIKDALYLKQCDLNNQYFIESNPPINNEDIKPIHQFYMANPWLWRHTDPEDELRISNISEIAKSFLAYIVQNSTKICSVNAKPYLFYCPKCGKKNENISSYGKQSIVKCPECGTRFYIDCREISTDSIKTIYLKSNASNHTEDNSLNKKSSFWHFFKKK